MENKNKTYVIAGCQPWSREAYEWLLKEVPGKWHFIDAPEALTAEKIAGLKPRTLFFLHWFWKVPAAIADTYECVCFHPTDLPYGRGGSPIQNLILRGHTETQNTAFRMTCEMDAGPVYLKEELLLEGSAEEIYYRFARLSARMIQRLVDEEWLPAPQQGEIVVFKRRKPEESEIPAGLSQKKLYDFIRMLDAPGYPKAFLKQENFRLEFGNASLQSGRLTACVEIK